MAPPTLAKLSKTFNDPSYLVLSDTLFMQCYRLLYNKEEKLFARDATSLIDANGNKTIVVADKAISYKKTEVIDLIGNVKIQTYDGKVLATNQLYFDQKNEWFFTEEAFTFKDADGSFLQGIGIDFSKDFKIFNMQNNNGEVNNM